MHPETLLIVVKISGVTGSHSSMATKPSNIFHLADQVCPSYRQRLKEEGPAYRTINHWSDQSDAILQHCFEHVDRETFNTRKKRHQLHQQMHLALTKTMKTMPSQKPSVNRDMCAWKPAQAFLFSCFVPSHPTGRTQMNMLQQLNRQRWNRETDRIQARLQQPAAPSQTTSSPMSCTPSSPTWNEGCCLFRQLSVQNYSASRLVSKLKDLGLNIAQHDWILDFMTDHLQVVRVDSRTGPPLILSMVAPQGCILSPLLYSLCMQNCLLTKATNTKMKFVQDTAVVGLISHSNEMANREEVAALEQRYHDNHLSTWGT